MAAEGKTINLNGESRTFDKLDLIEILKSIDISLDSTGVAVAVDDKLVRKGEWRQYKLNGGERVEVITAAQGG